MPLRPLDAPRFLCACRRRIGVRRWTARAQPVYRSARGLRAAVRRDRSIPELGHDSWAERPGSRGALAHLPVGSLPKSLPLRWRGGTVAEPPPATRPDAQPRCRITARQADWTWYPQLVPFPADRAANNGSVYRSRYGSLTSGGASPAPGPGPSRSPCGRTGEIAESWRPSWVKPDKAITRPAGGVRQAKQPGDITAIGFLLRCWELGARLQGGRCEEDMIAAVRSIGSGVQQRPVLYLTQVADYRCVAITVGEFCEGSGEEPVDDDQDKSQSSGRKGRVKCLIGTRWAIGRSLRDAADTGPTSVRGPNRPTRQRGPVGHLPGRGY
jgi:hypothetical protein